MNSDTEPNNAPGLAREAQRGERIAVAIGSTRPKRICPGIAEWFTDTVQQASLRPPVMGSVSPGFSNPPVETSRHDDYRHLLHTRHRMSRSQFRALCRTGHSLGRLHQTNHGKYRRS